MRSYVWTREPAFDKHRTMTRTAQHDFVAAQYGPRADAYVHSPAHRSGADLDQLEALVRERPRGRVLDLGCGGGHVGIRVAPYADEVVACDLSPEMLAAVTRAADERGLANLLTRQAAAEALPFPAASFDAVLCRFSAHHWDDLEAGLGEARRVLRGGGIAVFIDTVAPAAALLDTHLQAIELLRDASHVRDYTVAEWIASLARNGLAVVGLTRRRLRLEFASWAARTRTPAPLAEAIRSVQHTAPSAVRDHFEVADDGSFTLDTLTVLAE